MEMNALLKPFLGGDTETIVSLDGKISSAQAEHETAEKEARSAALDAEAEDNATTRKRANKLRAVAVKKRGRLESLVGACAEAKDRKRAADELAKAEAIARAWDDTERLAVQRLKLAEKIDHFSKEYSVAINDLINLSLEMHATAPRTDDMAGRSVLSPQSTENAIRCTLRHKGVKWAAPGESAGLKPHSVGDWVRKTNATVLHLRGGPDE